MNQATLFWKKNNSRFLLNKDPAGLISKKKIQQENCLASIKVH
jgi:hypothetical protein